MRSKLSIPIILVEERERLSKIDLRPRNFAEKYISLYIVGNFILYYLGLQYVLAPALAYTLATSLFFQLWRQNEKTPESLRLKVSTSIWILLSFVLVIGLALIVGCLDFDIDFTRSLSAFVNRWMRTWALVALFPMVGCLKIRPQIIFRAVCIFCIQALILCSIFGLLVLAKKSDFMDSYVSPFYVLGGGKLFYTVHILGTVFDVDTTRFVMNAPWSPALGLLGNIYFFLCLQEKVKLLKILGLIGAAALVALSLSRTAIVCLPSIFLIYLVMSRLINEYFLIATGFVSFIGAVFISELILLKEDFISGVRGYRQGSSKARDTLQQLALDGWQEAVIWGHGTFAESGPALVSGLGIGSHHTWYGLLFMHGLVGATALALAFLCTIAALVMKLGHSSYAALGISILLILLVFSFSENIDSLAYLYWPGLVVLGMALNQDRDVIRLS